MLESVSSNAVKNRTAVTISDLTSVPRIQATPDNPMTGQEKTQFDLERPQGAFVTADK